VPNVASKAGLICREAAIWAAASQVCESGTQSGVGDGGPGTQFQAGDQSNFNRIGPNLENNWN
jgi:hypothetical protein